MALPPTLQDQVPPLVLTSAPLRTARADYPLAGNGVRTTWDGRTMWITIPAPPPGHDQRPTTTSMPSVRSAKPTCSSSAAHTRAECCLKIGLGRARRTCRMRSRYLHHRPVLTLALLSQVERRPGLTRMRYP